MARKYQHTQELLPKIKEMLEGGVPGRVKIFSHFSLQALA